MLTEHEQKALNLFRSENPGCNLFDLVVTQAPELNEVWVICGRCRDRLRFSTDSAPSWWDTVDETDAQRIIESKGGAV